MSVLAVKHQVIFQPALLGLARLKTVIAVTKRVMEPVGSAFIVIWIILFSLTTDELFPVVHLARPA